MSTLTSIVRLATTARFRKLDKSRKNPQRFQHAIFKSLIMSGVETQFGERYGFNCASSVERFQHRVPLHDYDGLKPYIDRMRNGEEGVLWPTPVNWFAKSSGTTADKSKFIPVSMESLQHCHYQSAKDVLMFYVHNYPKSRIFNGKALTLGGSHKPETNGRIHSGDLSAVLIQNSPWYAELVRTPSRDISLIADFESKVQHIAKITIKQNVTNFSGVPSWNLVLMKRILEAAGKQHLLEVWPNLELFMHGGISFEPYREQYRQLIPSDQMHYMETYNASEGFFGIQDDPNDSAMLLLVDAGIFYEFIPMNKMAEAQAGTFTAFDTVESVKTGVNYAMVVSTNGGLWRYLIGDTVMFTSLYPHKLKITGRTRHFINVFGEELIMENAIKALQTACRKTGATVSNYTVAPIFMDDSAKGAHEWVVEFEKRPPDTNVFADILDAELCNVNSDYEAKRSKNTTLNRLTLTEVKPGTFYEWMKQRGKLGGQNKIPSLYNTREYVDELLKLKII